MIPRKLYVARQRALAVGTVEEIVRLVLQYPLSIRTEGIASIARRMGYSPEAIALGEQLGEEPAP
jgi:hypothetical protein